MKRITRMKNALNECVKIQFEHQQKPQHKRREKRVCEFVPRQLTVYTVTEHSAWQAWSTTGRWRDFCSLRVMWLTPAERDAQVSWQGCVCAGGGCSGSMLCVTNSVIFIFLAKGGGGGLQFTHEHTLLLLLLQWSLDTCTSSSLACEMRICIQGIKTNLMLWRMGGVNSCSCHLIA